MYLSREMWRTVTGITALLALLCVGAAQICSPVSVECSYSNPDALEQLKEEIQAIPNALKQIIQKELASLRAEIFEKDKIIKESLCMNRTGEIQMCAGNACLEILEERPDRPSGYYWLKACDSCQPFQAFCDFSLSLMESKGWMKVADLDTTDPTQQCPSQFELITSPRRVCGRSTDGAGCDSTIFETHGIRYEKVAGRMVGYGHNTPDGLQASSCSSCNINKPYVDGISITHGYPRNHIWTYAAGNDLSECPCAIGNTQYQPSYVGSDYYCEIGPESEPLWDGEDCSDGEVPCCLRVRQHSGWFIKGISTATTNDIEVRLCTDEPMSNENVRIERIELYVQ